MALKFVTFQSPLFLSQKRLICDPCICWKHSSLLLSDVNGHSMFGGDDVSSSCQIHQHRAQVRECRRGADVQPIRNWGCVSEWTHPQPMANAVPDVVRRHGDKEHPRQGAPGVFEASNPHEEAKRQTEDWDEGRAVERRTLRKRNSSLEWEGPSHVEVVQVDDGCQQSSQQHLIQVAFLPEPNHYSPGPESHQSVSGIVQSSAQPQVLLDDRQLQDVVSHHTEHTQSRWG